MIIHQRPDNHDAVIQTCRRMMTAIRTAPKAKGCDILETATVTEEDLGKLADEMTALYAETSRPVFQRDSESIRRGEAVVLIGMKPTPMGLNCGHCSFQSCGEKPSDAICAFNHIDLGIAIGSAVSLAADERVDTRVMYSVGMAAQRMGILPDCRSVIAIAVSATAKNPFFDRK